MGYGCESGVPCRGSSSSLLYYSRAQSWVTQKSMSLTYEPSSCRGCRIATGSGVGCRGPSPEPCGAVAGSVTRRSQFRIQGSECRLGSGFRVRVLVKESVCVCVCVCGCVCVSVYVCVCSAVASTGKGNPPRRCPCPCPRPSQSGFRALTRFRVLVKEQCCSLHRAGALVDSITSFCRADEKACSTATVTVNPQTLNPELSAPSPKPHGRGTDRAHHCVCVCVCVCVQCCSLPLCVCVCAVL